MTRLSIREADEADLSSILDLYAQPTVDNGERLGIDEARKIYTRILSYPRYRLYAATLNGAVVGTFALLIMDNLGHLGAPSAIIEAVAVNPASHRQGIGTRMMEYALEKSREAGCYKATLSADVKRKGAHRFYESLPFKRHGYSFQVVFGEDEGN